MEPRFNASPRAHVNRIAVTLAVLVVSGVGFRVVLMPEDFGKHGHYRPAAVTEEARRVSRNMTSESCFECHPLIRQLHVEGIHKTVSCEGCHGPYADHVKEDVVFAAMPVIRGEEIRPLCLRCHNRIIQSHPPDAIRMVVVPEHLEKRKVRTHHVCNQCHHVHAPLKWVHEAREMMGLPIEKEGV